MPPAAVASLNASLATEPARRLLAALAHYGGYIVDDTYWNATSICTESGVSAEFEEAYGFAYRASAGTPGLGGAWYADQLAIFRALSIVTSNAEDAPGGGGTPLQPPPPPFCD